MSQRLPAPPQFSIVVPTYNRPEQARICLGALSLHQGEVVVRLLQRAAQVARGGLSYEPCC